MSRAGVTGKNPNMQPCPRCGKPISAWWNGRFTVIPKHKAEDGKWCRREDVAPRTDLDPLPATKKGKVAT